MHVVRAARGELGRERAQQPDVPAPLAVPREARDQVLLRVQDGVAERGAPRKHEGAGVAREEVVRGRLAKAAGRGRGVLLHHALPVF